MAQSNTHFTKALLLDTAKETVAGRGKNYGKPEDNFARIACHWEQFFLNAKGTDINITPGDVAILMALMKIARLEHDPKHADSWIDLAGYAACGADIETAKKPDYDAYWAATSRDEERAALGIDLDDCA